jgi:hypothetical protein
MWFSSKKSREQEIEVKVNTILTSIIDDVNSFTHREQSIIVKKVFERFQEIKNQEVENKQTIIDEIKESLKILVDEK